ncbi:Transmembrane protein 69 [Psilocybe cubensis]|uniref:Transmembrane protein 69 n=2 Tax=Psilocybe cubensis TaxID=181762 RepID=A0ACB8H9D8_PSICU|nr:Transmembrane protein 69 [Psilocybe cubensis]KAH9484434.1 Transmembrane protein 69 [Psilocybe cubensis]
MNTLFRPLLRSVAVRNVPLAYRRPPPIVRRPQFMGSTSILQQARLVASSVSGRPGSQSLEHAATNVKEELGNSAQDLAKMIAGANVTMDSVVDSSGASFIGITSKIAHEVPQPIFVLGLAGGIPYIAASATTVYLAHKAQLAASGLDIGMDPGVALTILDQALNLQVTYGAVMLSFLGAMHWGMEFAAYGGHKGFPRLILGTIPMLVAWPTLGMQPMTALIVQWCGFTGLWYADSKATVAGWTPKWYSQYRFYLSILVGTCIIGSLAGTSYFGPVAGHGLLTHDLDELREERRKTMPSKHGMIVGPIEAVPAPENADHFTRIHKRDIKQEQQKQQ